MNKIHNTRLIFGILKELRTYTQRNNLMNTQQITEALNKGLNVYWLDYKHQLQMLDGHIHVVLLGTCTKFMLRENDLKNCFIV